MVPRTLPRGSRARDLVARVSDSACVFSVACVRTCHGDTTCRYCTPRVAGFIFRFQSFFHENTRVPPFHWWVPDFRSQPSAASLLRKFQSLPSPPPPLWHPAYADSSASRQTARWTHVNKGLQASMSSASTSSSYCLKNEVYKIKNHGGACATRSTAESKSYEIPHAAAPVRYRAVEADRAARQVATIFQSSA